MSTFLYLAAPLEDNSDAALRALWCRYGADVAFSEMVHATALARGSKSSWSRLQFPDDSPTGIQLLAYKEDDLRKFLTELTPPKNFKGINFNLGCPSPNVTGSGLGCAMVKRVSKVQKLIDVVREFKIPISIKMRLGLNEYEKKHKVYLNLIKGTTPDYFIVHARHGTQKYSDPADFSVYDECVATGKSIVANGDISTKEQVDDLKKRGLKGIMIGRAAVVDPAIFNRLKGKEAPNAAQLKQEYLELTKEYGTHERYLRNVLKRIGGGKNAVHIDDNRLI